MVLEYYQLLRSVLRAKPHLRPCLKRCRCCGIFFLTHPRNAGRQNLRCPFGCREVHRKRESTRRSVAFYREHRDKRRLQNGKRCRRAPPVHPAGQGTEQVPSPPCGPREPALGGTEPVLQKVKPELVEHVRVVVSLIEGRAVSRERILTMLAKVLRQLRIGRRRKIDQTVAWLNEHPP